MPAPNSWSDSSPAGLSGSSSIDALSGRVRWTSSSITYSYPGYGSSWNSSFFTGYGPNGSNEEPWSAEFAPLSESDQGYFDAAAQRWANVANIQLTRIAETPGNVGDIRAAYTYLSITDDAQAWAYLPSDTSYGGDVWFNALGTSAELHWTPGSYEYLVAVHELGHALGLKHPFSGSPVLSVSQDSMSSTVMSYSVQPGDEFSGFDFYPTTPMILDIAAIQYLYGANNSYHTGNDSYVFSDATQYHETIWDAGGSDTIVYGGSENSTIDLRSGVDFGSQIGLPVHVISIDEVELHEVNNVWIANGVVIENATGGSGDDVLVGNDANNTLTGGEGNDTLAAGPGNDTLRGGADDDSYLMDGAGDAIVENADEGVDTVFSKLNWTLEPNVENLVLTGTKKVNGTGNDGDNGITGSSGKNTLAGGLGGDSLDGGEGKDLLEGGAGDDTLRGGEGADTLNGGDGNDTIDSGAGKDKVSGGSGQDAFFFDSLAGGDADKIDDFHAAEDEFAFDGGVFQSLAGGIDADNLVFAVKPAAHDADDFLLFNTKSGKLYYDADGSGGEAAVLLATVKGTLAGLDADNFTLA